MFESLTGKVAVANESRICMDWEMVAITHLECILTAQKNVHLMDPTCIFVSQTSWGWGWCCIWQMDGSHDWNVWGLYSQGVLEIFAQTVIASIENNPGIQNLHRHIVKSEVVSIKFTKVLEHTIVRRQISCSTGECAPHQYNGHVIPERVVHTGALESACKHHIPLLKHKQQMESKPSLFFRILAL